MTDAGRASDEAGFTELRTLLVGPEQREISALQARLADPIVWTRDVSVVLPDAIARRAGDVQLAHALTPPVEEAITASVRRDPQPLADALFPAIGPAIRKAIVHTLASMMESLNRTIEQSVSWRAARWRWTALRTGRPFAEVVLMATLQYRVEQVFLIHRETGLLLQHVTADRHQGPDADQVSAMLTAIQDFARDSFSATAEESLDTLRLGDLTVVVEQGPHALLAGVVRGTAPATLREAFQTAIEVVHRQVGGELAAFAGDAAPFVRTRPVLEACLVSHFRESPRPRAKRAWVLAASAVVLAAIGWAALTVRDRQRWSDYLERLDAEPGIVVLASGRRNGRFVVAGLRDPLAIDPAVLLAQSPIDPATVEGRWEPYEALHPPFVAARATALLRPPPGVTLAYDDGVLRASGSAPALWIVDSERVAPAMAGVRRFEYAGVAPEERLRTAIDSVAVRFVRGQASLAPGQDEATAGVVILLSELNEVIRARRGRVRVEIVGHTDSDGSELANVPLSQARADAMLERLRAHQFDALELTATGVGSAVPLYPGTSDEDKQGNRRVSFRVHLPGTPASHEPRP